MQRKVGLILRLGRGVSILFVMLALTIGGLAPAISFAQQNDNTVDPAALNQIAALLAEKAARTPTEQKVDSNLLYAFKRATGAQLSAAAATLQADVPFNAQGAAIVDITTLVNDALLNRIEALGGKILSVYPEYRSVRAAVPINQISTIASWREVIFIQPAQQAMTADRAPSTPAHRLAFTADVTATNALAVQPFSVAATRVTSTTPLNRSAGDVTHRTDQARRLYGYTGAGEKVCVLSDGVDSLASLQASGDLPSVTVVPGQAGSGDEGAAMLEIVHDLAPSTQLLYATAFTSVASFAANIKTLRNTYGCDVIVDDVSYFVETPFQLGQAPSLTSNTNGGLIAQAVNDVVANGALYFSAAGNSGNVNDNTAGVWEGNFVAGGAVAAPISGSGQLQNFDSGGTNQTYNRVTAASSGPVTLFWADPLGGSSNDYDLFLLNAAGTAVVNASTNVQNGAQDPYEQTAVTASANQRIVVVQRPGAAARYLHVNTNRGQLQFATPGQTGGHAAALGGFGVAAADAQNPPVIFSGSTTVETFSSDGPRRYFFNPDSTPITPGNFSSTGGAVAQKPDLTAADGVSCAAPGFNPFFGTSAAAPHAAAIAALLRSAQPTLTNAQLRTLLTSAPAALDIEAPGVDRDSGAGVLDAFAAMQTLNPSAVPLLSVDAIRTGEGPLSNSNGVIESGESFTLTVALSNTTLAAATDVQVSLELFNPPTGVQLLTPDPVRYGALAASGGHFSNTAQPFGVALASSVPCGTTLNFKITATYSGGGSNSPQVFFASLPIGLPLAINTTLDTTAPPSSATPPAYSTATGTQTGRLTRNGVASTCSTNKTNPGLFTNTGARRYDAYTFTNTTADPACVTVTLNTPQNENNSGLFMDAYGASGFVPASPAQNYLADAGDVASIQTPATFSFLVPAGQPATIVVHELNSGAGTGAGLGAYTLNLAGSGFGVCAAPPAQPASITAVAGSGQSTPISTTFPTTLQALVKDTGGNPLPGLSVTFNAPGSGASGVFSGGVTTLVTLTNASGVATVPAFTANGALGSYSVQASVLGYPGAGSASFGLTNTLGSPASITAIAGASQRVPISTTFATRLQALVKDATGHPLPGINVTFSAPSNGASGVFSGSATTVMTPTNANGMATAPTFAANGIPGSYPVQASVFGYPGVGSASFVLTNTLGLTASITAVAGTPQHTPISTTFATRLQALVKDTTGIPRPGISVTFTAPISGPTGSFPGGVTTIVTQTNNSGVATAPPFTANRTLGSYRVLAHTPGITTTASFVLTNTLGLPASITATAGALQQAAISTTFAVRLQATVRDAAGHPLPDISVTFSTPISGSSGSFPGNATSVVTSTNASGVATAPPFTANDTPGGYSVLATAPGVSLPARFDLVNLASASDQRVYLPIVLRSGP